MSRCTSSIQQHRQIRMNSSTFENSHAIWNILEFSTTINNLIKQRRYNHLHNSLEGRPLPQTVTASQLSIAFPSKFGATLTIEILAPMPFLQWLVLVAAARKNIVPFDGCPLHVSQRGILLASIAKCQACVCNRKCIFCIHLFASTQFQAMRWQGN
jgi:hypothetical protein